MSRNYFDHNASSPPTVELLELQKKAMTATRGSASSLHQEGRLSRIMIESARDTLADLCDCLPGEVIFTSGGTESNNWALKGAYFAIGTWVMAEVFRLSFAQASSLGGGSGSSLPVDVVKSLADSRSGREALSYWLALGAAITVIACVYLFLRSNRGLALTAIRDSEVAASGLGIDIWRTKLEVYVVTSAFTAIIGGLIFLQKLRISPDAAFSVNDWTAFVIFIVVIGGIGTLEGPILGTLLFFALRETLADFGTVYLIALGVVAIVVMLKAPKGVWGLIRDRFDLELFPLSYRVRVRNTEK